MNLQFAKLIRSSSEKIYPERSWKSSLKRLFFSLRVLRSYTNLSPLLSASPDSSIRRTLLSRPDLLGIVDWPYMCNHWSLNRKVQLINLHHKIIDSHPFLDIEIGEQRTFLDLNSVSPGLSLVCDRPNWFVREGELCINLFVDGVRVYSLAFSFSEEDQKLVAYIGAIQGRDLPGIQNIYHDLTKNLHGCRPRDFLVFAFVFLCNTLGIGKIYGVADSHRHHRHKYFKKDHKSENSSNYDEVWRDRGAVDIVDGFHLIPAVVVYKQESQIPSKKRALYRRRYELLEVVKLNFYALAMPA